MDYYKSFLLGHLLTSCLSKNLYLVLLTSMSGPSQLLLNLGLDEMPVTRSQGQHFESGRGSQSRGRGRLNPLGRPSPSSSRSDLNLPSIGTPNIPPGPPQPAQPIRLAPYISVDHLQYIDQGRSRYVPLRDNSYYAIQLNPVSVRIGDPAGGPGRVECTCPVFQRTLLPCDHIYVSYPLTHIRKPLPMLSVALCWIVFGSSSSAFTGHTRTDGQRQLAFEPTVPIDQWS